MPKIWLSLLLISWFTISCDKSETSEIPELAEGEFYLELFNDQDKLLFSKKGNAVVLKLAEDDWQLRFTDKDEDRRALNEISSFAYMVFFKKSIVTGPEEGPFSQNDRIWLADSWYSFGPDAWSYASKEGSMNITEVSNSVVKGSFITQLGVSDQFKANPFWGENITVKAHFAGKCAHGIASSPCE